MIAADATLVQLLRLVDQVPLPAPQPRRGRPPRYSDRLVLKAVVVMVVRRLPTVHLLLSVLEQPTAEMQHLRALLSEDGQFPSRRTWERRLARLPDLLPVVIGALGRRLVDQIQPWQGCGRAAAIDSTVLTARGGVWHRKHREAGIVPHTAIDTEAHWTKSGWHGWVYGWKLHVVTTVGPVWIPLAADLTPANVADNEAAPTLLTGLPTTVRFLLGDTAYQDPDLHAGCARRGLILIASRRGPHPHTDDGAAVRRVFHQLRSHAIENFNGQFKAIFDVHAPVPTRGLRATRRFALAAVLVYQLTLWLRFLLGVDLRVGLKPFLRAA